MVATMASHCTIATARRALARSFGQAGLDTPDLDARILVGHALGLDLAGLVAGAQRALTGAERERIAGLARRRLAREPVARIVGIREFWGLPLSVSPAVLVPRPETETVVETALSAVDAGGPRTRPLRIADLGTGSGALLLALLSELPAALGVATDLSEAAVRMARHNASRLGLLQRSRFIVCDFAAALAGPFDLVVANPPYVTSDRLARLEPEVREHDPVAALDGGVDGLAAYRAIAAGIDRALAPGGSVVLELAEGQADSVAALFAAAGLSPLLPARADLAGVPRALHIRARDKGQCAWGTRQKSAWIIRQDPLGSRHGIGPRRR
jgi:release factor glutamine methyltransferase